MILCRRFLEYAVTDGEVRKQDGTSVISAVGSNVIGRPIAWNFVRSRWNYIMKEQVFFTNHQSINYCRKKDIWIHKEKNSV